jgi:hypothetical protein
MRKETVAESYARKPRRVKRALEPCVYTFGHDRTGPLQEVHGLGRVQTRCDRRSDSREL